MVYLKCDRWNHVEIQIQNRIITCQNLHDVIVKNKKLADHFLNEFILFFKRGLVIFNIFSDSFYDLQDLLILCFLYL